MNDNKSANKEGKLTKELGNLIDKISRDDKDNLSYKSFVSESRDIWVDEMDENIDEIMDILSSDNISEKSKTKLTNNTTELISVKKDEKFNFPESINSDEFSDNISEDTQQFMNVFDDIKKEQRNDKKKAEKRKKEKIEKIKKSRSPEIEKKLEKASQIYDESNSNDNVKTENIEETALEKNSENQALKPLGDSVKKNSKDFIKNTDKKVKKASKNTDNHELKLFKKQVNEEYVGILEIASKTYSHNSFDIINLTNENLEEPLMKQCEKILKSEKVEAQVESKPKDTSADLKWAKMENAFFEENSEEDENKDGNAEVIEYTEKKDEAAIDVTIFKSKCHLIFRTIILLVLFLISVAFVCIKKFSFPNADGSTFNNTVFYMLSQLIPLIVGMIISRNTIINGLRAIIRFKGNSDAAVTFASFTSLVYNIILLFNINTFNAVGYNIYSIIPLFGLLLNSFGKLEVVKRIFVNFKFLKSTKNKYAAELCNDEYFIEKLKKSSGKSNKGFIAYQEKIDFIEDFLKKSYQPDSCELLSGKIAPIGIIFSIVLAIIEFIFKKDFLNSVSILASVSSAFIPMFAILALNWVLFKFCKNAVRKGVMLINCQGISYFSSAEYVTFNASDIYFGNAVSLQGVKMMSDYSPERLVLEITAILNKASSPLSGAFKKIIKGREDVLPLVEKYRYYDNKGIEAYIMGKKFLIGNRALLSSNAVLSPAKEIEDKYLSRNKYVTYVAVGRELCAMLVVSYKPTSIATLQKLEDEGIRILVTTSDPNITAKLISEQFRIYYRSVKILKSGSSEFFENALKNSSKHSKSYIATDGKAIPFANLISSCVRLKTNITATIITQILLVIIFAMIVTLFNFYFGVDSVKTFEFLLCEVLGSLLMIIIPRIRKP